MLTLTHNNILDSIKPLSSLPGIGEKLQEAFARLGCFTTSDLLFYLPTAYQKWHKVERLSPEYISKNIIIKCHFLEAITDRKGRKKRTRLICETKNNYLTLVYFNFYPNYMVNKVKPGQEIIVSGKLDRFLGEYQIAHPAYFTQNHYDEIPQIEPVYPLTYGIISKQVNKYVRMALDQLCLSEDWHRTGEFKFNIKQALEIVHNPRMTEGVDFLEAKKRIKYDELLASQIAMQVVKYRRNKVQANPLKFNGDLVNKLTRILSFELTHGQQVALKDIEQDLKSEIRMMRLLQGDVGSGKTIVALLAMLDVVESGGQAALMVPTDILARQHYEYINELCSQIEINITLLTGKTRKAEKRKINEQLESGKIDIVVGTHAIFQEEVAYKNIQMIVIDEQHRFGVKQRMQLSAKGRNPHMLVMSATPIPRTLTIASYGDMDISIIAQKPTGRKPVHTSIVSSKSICELGHSLKKIISKGEQIYWICPLVEDNEANDLVSVEFRKTALERIYPGKVGLVHGKMKQNEKETNMEQFVSGNTKILVATTVIEVGVNVPNATLIIIEHAERFGLAQLHQLRGRVGRGNGQSYCILVYGKQITKVGVERLKIMRDSNDGFYIAEQDLVIRGGGEVLGTKQSGSTEFKVADIFVDKDLLKKAAKHAREIWQQDPALIGMHKKYRDLLYLFEYHRTIEYVNSG